MPSVAVSTLHSPRRFLDLQRRFYRDDPHYVPPLTGIDKVVVDPRRHPFYRHADAEFWVAERQGRTVGRISAFRDRFHDDFHGDRIGFFGHFEAVDAEVTQALIDTATTWLREHGATRLRGPVDLSTNYRCGLLVDGEAGTPFVMMPHNPREYGEWLESTGLAKARDLLALILTSEMLDFDRTVRVVRRIEKRTSAQLRRLDLKRFQSEIATLWQLYNRIWERNWGFVPMSEGEFRQEAKGFRSVLRPELTCVVENAGEPVAFAVGVPDVNLGVKACDGRLLPFGWWKLLRTLRTVTRFRVLTLGIVPEYRNTGIDALMLHRLIVDGQDAGFDTCECSWVLEDNVAMMRPLEALGAKVYRRYRVYEKPI